MNSTTSIGPGPDKGGNRDSGNADGRGNQTLGEHEMPEPEAGRDEAVEQADGGEETVGQQQG
jgi:hypothetical protein